MAIQVISADVKTLMDNAAHFLEVDPDELPNSESVWRSQQGVREALEILKNSIYYLENSVRNLTITVGFLEKSLEKSKKKP